MESRSGGLQLNVEIEHLLFIASMMYAATKLPPPEPVK
jgi:hypothetical protein